MLDQIHIYANKERLILVGRKGDKYADTFILWSSNLSDEDFRTVLHYAIDNLERWLN